MEKMDRRVRKTRALLLQGLVKMLETHDIQDISVKELTELVDINRGTFYLHYDDIYDMLHKVADEMFLEFNEIMEQKPVVTNSLASQGPLLEFFRFLDRNRDLAKVMIGPHGDLAFVNRLKDQIEKRTLQVLESAQSDANYEYLCSFIITGWKDPVPRPRKKWEGFSVPCVYVSLILLRGLHRLCRLRHTNT